MGRFILRRLAQGALVVFLVTVVVFVTTRLVGDPVDVLLPFESTPEQRAEFRHQLGLDRSIPVQFWEYLKDVAHLDFGQSLVLREDAMGIVLERLPATLELVAAGMGLAFVVSMVLGVLAALRPGGWFDRVAVVGSLAALSMPEFWVGLLLIYIFAVWLGVLPSSGKGGLDHLILPAVTMAFATIGRMVMIVRSSMLDELAQPYVQTARAKGLSGFRTVGVHAMRNVSVPVVTLFGWEVILALAGYTAVVETVFAWPGIGFLAYNAIVDQDLILLQAIVFLVAIFVVVINILIDVLYRVIDPRIQLA
ncbi:ABC transporter permease [Gaiella sp.]|jgi:peptide/nickel transport system permease protein|uniref:ABC transporter permease n=1 Tax=Gaiella sp. TaxID=2663207 RepID=UPI002C153E16|nr:ABC transporter permease [Gaiella sp.]HWO81609.1 ABC transporter permease [Gaiella sp.]